MNSIANYIDGKFCQALEGSELQNFNPATGEMLGTIPDSNADDLESAVAAAKKAFPAWSKLKASERAAWLRKLAAKIRENLNELAMIETRDNGKPIKISKSVDIPRSALNFEFFADEIEKFHDTALMNSATLKNTVTYSPLGVVGCISPWNLPLYLFTWKIAPALAAGNTVVAKPSEVTPMTAHALSRLMDEINFPAGVLNIVHGLGPKIGQALVDHPEVKAISFTGSTATGKIIARAAAENFKKVSLELGGKNPTIIFADANLEDAISGSTRAAFSNQGQICLCGSRIFVERSVYEQVKFGMIQKISEILVGNPELEATQFGAMVSKDHFEKVRTYLNLARAEGITLLTGSTPLDLPEQNRNGFFILPTLLEGAPSEHRLNQEEIFGPVACLIPFDSENEVIEQANSTRYGLAASVWSTHQEKLDRVSEKLEAGIVWQNCWMERDLRTPFGGVKESGVGREGGEYALKFFSELKTVCQKERV